MISQTNNTPPLEFYGNYTFISPALGTYTSKGDVIKLSFHDVRNTNRLKRLVQINDPYFSLHHTVVPLILSCRFTKVTCMYHDAYASHASL